MLDVDHDLLGTIGAPCPAPQPDAGVTAAADDHCRQFAQFPARELDIYGNQLARCLKALGTDAPIRADIQRELITVRAEQDARAARASEPARTPDISRLTPGALHRTRRELQASLALARPGSPARRLILTHLSATDTDRPTVTVTKTYGITHTEQASACLHVAGGL